MHKFLFVGVAVAAAGLAACGGTTYPRSAAPPSHDAAATQTPKVAPTTAVPTTPDVLVATSSKGMYLTDASGRALYVFTADHGATSACTGSCARDWPALVSHAPVGGPGVLDSALGIANGQVPNQVTYYGRLLYNFAGDPHAGTTNGLSVPGWLLVAPGGTPFGASAPTAPAAAPVTHPAPAQAPVTQPAPAQAPVTHPAPAQAPVTQPAPPATTPITQNPTPQGGGGDGDGDNSGGPSDGDGNV
jgi:predicted lipoprotein with Yx(FWY)xxD motif